MYKEEKELLNDLWILELEKKHWTRALVGGNAPSGRFAHVMCRSPAAELEIVVLGGLTAGLRMSDLTIHVLRQSGAREHWRVVEEEGEEEKALAELQGAQARMEH